QCAGVGSAVLRQASAGLRSQMRRQRSLSAARDRNHPAREAAQGTARELRFRARPLTPSPLVGEGGEGGGGKGKSRRLCTIARPPPLTPPHKGEGNGKRWCWRQI